MSESASTTSPAEEVLVRFVQELDETPDREALVRQYQAAHPALAEQFQAMAAMMQKVDRSRSDAGEQLPEQLGGFRLGRRLAHGGMGEVYEAREERLQRRVAVKIIRRGQISPMYRARFLREQLVLARLHQTHIVPIFAAGEVGTFQYFAMPYIEGAALHHALEVARQQPTSWPGGKTPDLSTLAELYWAGSGPGAAATAPYSGAATAPAATAFPAPRPALSWDYFRSVARVMADVADGLQHAHNEGIIHRDVKPSNIMIETGEKCWIIDFGLAGYLRKLGAEGPSREAADLGPDPGAVSGIIGTPQYMAPEQWTEPPQVDARTDVWGLGATLYELLTLKRAFEGSNPAEIRIQVLSPDPVTSLQGVSGLPADLAAVCLKALQKKPEQRYPTAREFAEDLRRWLRLEPTSVGRARTVRRIFLWAHRNKGWVATIAVALVASLLVAVMAGIHRERMQEGERQALIRQIQSLRHSSHTVGWSDKTWDLARQAAEIRRDDDVRNQAAAALAGLDARSRKHLRHGASAVAWDHEGKRLLMGASKNGTSSLWDSERDEEIRFEHGGRGPVAFRADGTAVQLVANPKDRWSLGLWDVAKRRQIRSFQIPPGAKAEPATALNPVLLAVTGHGAFVAAATSEVDDKGQVVKGHLAAWDSGTGKVLVKTEGKMTALALSPDGALLAAGEEDGRIRLWSLREGKELDPLRSGWMTVHCLAFGRNLHRPEASREAQTPSWLLASGEAGGAVTVWDLRTRQVKSRCYGSHWDVYALAFSPDGMTLASAGRDSPNLWDVGTGRLLLMLGNRDQATDLAFSPDGRRLAVSSDHGVPGRSDVVVVYELDFGRGMQSLRGLVGQIAHVRFSPDGRWLAALSQNWQVAVWDLKENHLLHVFDVPKGLFADNADLCFSPDGNRFAFVTGRQAKMWEVASGRELGSWDLPPGLTDRLAFRSDDKLVLFRMETASGLPPFGQVSWREHPRVSRIRHLTLPKQIKLVAKIEEFKKHVFTAAISPDGSYIVAAGLGGPDGKHRTVRIYDGTTGKEVGTLPLDRTKFEPFLRLDATGKILAYAPADRDQATLVDVPSRKVRGVLPNGPWSLGPGANYWVSSGPAYPAGLTLVRRQDGKPLFRFGIDSGVNAGPFSADGTRLAWDHADGSVTVCDIPAVQRQLAAIGLGW